MKGEMPMARFILTGDITHAGRVEVNAKNLQGAIRKAEQGDFMRVVEETQKQLGFIFCGDTEGGVEKFGEPSAQDIRILGKKASGKWYVHPILGAYWRKR
jgi:hypothetical protein